MFPDDRYRRRARGPGIGLAIPFVPRVRFGGVSCSVPRKLGGYRLQRAELFTLMSCRSREYIGSCQCAILHTWGGAAGFTEPYLPIYKILSASGLLLSSVTLPTRQPRLQRLSTAIASLRTGMPSGTAAKTLHTAASITGATVDIIRFPRSRTRTLIHMTPIASHILATIARVENKTADHRSSTYRYIISPFTCTHVTSDIAPNRSSYEASGVPDRFVFFDEPILHI